MSAIQKAWLTTKEAGEYTSTSKWTVLRWINDGLPHARLSARQIRIKTTDLEEWMEKYVNRGEDIEAQLEKARRTTQRKMKAIGIPCSIKPRGKRA